MHTMPALGQAGRYTSRAMRGEWLRLLRQAACRWKLAHSTGQLRSCTRLRTRCVYRTAALAVFHSAALSLSPIEPSQSAVCATGLAAEFTLLAPHTKWQYAQPQTAISQHPLYFTSLHVPRPQFLSARLVHIAACEQRSQPRCRPLAAMSSLDAGRLQSRACAVSRGWPDLSPKVDRRRRILTHLDSSGRTSLALAGQKGSGCAAQLRAFSTERAAVLTLSKIQRFPHSADSVSTMR